jgi:6-phosphogluconolactonase
MQLVSAPTPGEAAARAARHIAEALRQAVAERGVAIMALSGGTSPVPMLAELASQALAWDSVRVFQVDERVAPDEDAARNLVSLESVLCRNGPLPRGQLHAMPVNDVDLEAAAAAYGRELESQAGRPPLLDVVHLGLGADGHTASLFPGDPALTVTGRSVAPAGLNAGYRRLTLTLPVINAAHDIIWFVTGSGKADVLARLLAGKLSAPAGQVSRGRATVFADDAAAGK